MTNQLPIAETFHSIQGEGTYVGTPMHFIRLAGCPVGAKATHELVNPPTSLPIPSMESNPNRRASYCKTWDGRAFICDTDFSCHTHKDVSELIDDTYESHICLTGGEPLIHQERLISLGFFKDVFARGIMVHIETSGTVILNDVFSHDSRVWVAIAPKKGFLPEMIKRADELKFLVDENFSPIDAKEITLLAPSRCQVWLSPINGENEVNHENVKIAREHLKGTNWRLSCQWHKFLGLR